MADILPDRSADLMNRIDAYLSRPEPQGETPETDAAERNAVVEDVPGQLTTDKVVSSVITRSLERRLREAEKKLNPGVHDVDAFYPNEAAERGSGMVITEEQLSAGEMRYLELMYPDERNFSANPEFRKVLAEVFRAMLSATKEKP